MKRIIVAALLAIAISIPAKAQSSGAYFQHASLTPSSVQGQLVLGGMYTNAGWSQVTELPLFYHNNKNPNANWYDVSWSPLSIGGSVGNNSAAANIGALVDVGNQIVYGIEGIVGSFNSNAGQTVTTFFNCSAATTACGTLSAGLLNNWTVEENGNFSQTWHQVFRHPVGYFIGPSILFGGPSTPATARRG